MTVFFDTKTWRAELPSGIQLGDETFRRLCCDARFEAIGRADGQLVTAAAPHRNIPRWLRRAAKRRDHGCRFPGCGHIRRTQLHHVVPCASHGPTILENLITLCLYHHKLLHEGGWKITGALSGPIKFIKPDGTEYIEDKPPPIQLELATALAEAMATLGGALHPLNRPTQPLIPHLHSPTLRSGYGRAHARGSLRIQGSDLCVATSAASLAYPPASSMAWRSSSRRPPPGRPAR